MSEVRTNLLRAIGGDVTALRSLAAYSDEALRHAAAELGDVELTAHAVANVVRGLVSGEYPDGDVQQWACFVRWGFIAEQRPLDALRLEYSPDDEDDIVEVVARLTELGDLIDGELLPGEAGDFLRLLGEPPE